MRQRSPVPMRRLGLLLCVALVATHAVSDASIGQPSDPRIPINLDFSRPGLVDPASPWGWYTTPLAWVGIAAEVAGPDASGARALRLRRDEDGPAGEATYFLEGPIATDHRLSVTGRVEWPDDSAAGIRLALTSWGDAGRLAIEWSDADCAREGAARGDSADCEIALTTTPEATSVRLSIEYSGSGPVLVRDLALAVDGEPLIDPYLPGQGGPDAEQIAWARGHAIPLAGTDPEAPDDDLAALAPLIGDAPVVMLGESTHGTREFFRLRHRLIRWLVERQGFTVVAIEDHTAPARAIDAYLQTGDGDPAELVGGLFGVWAREETLEMVRWLRAHNVASATKVRMAGFDLQVPLGPMRALDAFAAGHDPELAEVLDRELAPMRAAWEEQWYPQREAEELARWMDAARSVREIITARADGYRARLDATTVERVLFDARLIEQSAEVSAGTDDWRLRDRLMAENLAWIREHEPPGTRIAVWAHNSHVRLNEGAMGEAFVARYPGEVESLGLFTDRGEYTAYDPVRREMRAYALFPAPPQSIEFLLAQAGPATLVVDLAPSSSTAVPEWLRTPRFHRNIGLYAADLGFYPAPMTASFTGLVFTETSSPTRPIAGRAQR